MKLIINNSSMQPIYDQIVTQIKSCIMKRELKEEDMLPSVRTLAKELRVSALTVKKAYDALEADQNLLMEEKKKEVETGLEAAIRKGRSSGLSDQEITELFYIVLED